MKNVIFILLCFYMFSCNVFSKNTEKIFYDIGNDTSKLIALSFDDGPGLNTEEILKILDDKKVKATFFMLGTSVEKNIKLVKEIYSKGHEIANHTYNHINFFEYKEQDKKYKIEKELIDTQKLIESIIGYKTKLVRYPIKYFEKDAIDIAKKNDYKAIGCTFGIDWVQDLSTKEMLEMYLKNIMPGCIFLMHDLPKNSKVIEILPVLIDEAKKEGYKFVIVSEIIK